MAEIKPVLSTMGLLIRSYEDCFAKFGWMFLSLDNENANLRKISIYLDTIDHLIVDISYKMETIQSLDKKEELHIMLDNSKTIKEYANKNFHDCFLIKPNVPNPKHHLQAKLPFI